MQSLGVARAMLFMALGISASQVLAAPVPAGDSSAEPPAVKAAPVPSAPSASPMLEVPQVTLEATTPAPQELGADFLLTGTTLDICGGAPCYALP